MFRDLENKENWYNSGDLAFEYSDVEADIVGGIVSVKNPKSGVIRVDSVGEVIFEDSVMDVEGKVVVREKLWWELWLGVF